MQVQSHRLSRVQGDLQGPPGETQVCREDGRGVEEIERAVGWDTRINKDDQLNDINSTIFVFVFLMVCVMIDSLPDLIKNESMGHKCLFQR